MSQGQPGWDDALAGIARPGEVLLGKYRIERIIGYGGMGVVVEAWHIDLEEQVAIKFLLPSLGANSEAIARFKREGRLLFKLKSDHVCRVLDVGELPGGVPFMTMEFLAGRDLGTMLESREPFPVDVAVDYGLQTCQALAEAHVRGIVHRDLKPENLFASARPDGSTCIKLLDFGLSKLTTEPDDGKRERNLTSDAQAMGTPNYMSPEQWMSVRDVGPASDQWAVGAILFELLTGQAPFDAPQIGQICQKVLNAPPPPLLDLRPDAPPGLATVVQKCLEKNPAQRYANVGALAVALSPFAPPGTTQAAERTLKMLSGAQAAERRSLDPRFEPLGSDPGVRAPSDMQTTSPTPLQTGDLGPSAAFPPRRSDTAQSWHQAATGFSSGGKNKLAIWGAGATLVAMAILAMVLVAAPGDEPESTNTAPAVPVPPEEATQVIEPEVEPDDPTESAAASATATAAASASASAPSPKAGGKPPATGKSKPTVTKTKRPPHKPKDGDDPLFEHR